MPILEEILKKTVTAAIDIADSDLYGVWNIGATLLNCYFPEKTSKTNNITAIAMATLAIDSVVWPWLNGRTLHSEIGLNPGSPYEGFSYILERLALGCLNLHMFFRNLSGYRIKETKS